jgi:hypothetical protein
MPDFSVLQEKQKDKQGKTVPNKFVAEFDEVVQKKLDNLNYEASDTTTQMYAF